MDFVYKAIAIVLITFNLKVFASYNCRLLIDDSGKLSEVITTIKEINTDSSILTTLETPFNLDDASFIKYQFWADAGYGYYLIHFIGLHDEFNDLGEPHIASKNLFCSQE